MYLWDEKDLSTSQDVAGAYSNEGTFSGAMSSGDLHRLDEVPDRRW
jgi:hypothetical protein